MLKTLQITLSFLLISLAAFTSHAQSGEFDVRLVEHNIDCDNSLLFIDVEVKAHSAATHFNLSDQNYRISFERGAFRTIDVNLPEEERSVQIFEELTIHDFVAAHGTNSFYNEHTLNGSTDTVISYNIELSGGDGYPLEDTQWVPVGRLSLEILDLDKCGRIWIHNDTPNEFPNTFVGEKFAGVLFETDPRVLQEHTACFPVACAVNQAPSASDDYVNTLEGYSVEYNILFNDSDPDGTLNPGTVTLITMPPASEATVTVNPITGFITVTPAEGFYGDVTPFQYEVCDDQGLCNIATIYVTIDNDPNNNPTTANEEADMSNLIKVYPTLAQNELTVAYENLHTKMPMKVIVVDVTGRQLEMPEQLVGGSNSFRLEVENLAKGSYFLKMILDDKVVVKRFTKI